MRLTSNLKKTFLIIFCWLFLGALPEANLEANAEDSSFTILSPRYSSIVSQFNFDNYYSECKEPFFEDNHEDLAYREAHKNKNFYKEWRKAVDINENAKIYKEWHDRKSSLVKWLYGNKNIPPKKEKP